MNSTDEETTSTSATAAKATTTNISTPQDPTQYNAEELRTNESLALTVERIWFLQTELRPRIAIIKHHLDHCNRSLSMRQTTETIPLIPFDVGGAFSGFIGVDGCFVCKGEFAIKRPSLLSSSNKPIQQQQQQQQSTSPTQTIFRTSLAQEKCLTLSQVQDSHNLVRIASELLSSLSKAPAAPETKWSAPSEIEQALEHVVKAWELLTHPPIDFLFPNRVSSSQSRLFEPNTPEDILIEAAVASGETIIHAYVLNVDWSRSKTPQPLAAAAAATATVTTPSSSQNQSNSASSQSLSVVQQVQQRAIFSKLESTDNIQIGGSWVKSHTFTNGSNVAVLAHHEVHVLAPRLACAYKHASYALGELSALRDIILALDH